MSENTRFNLNDPEQGIARQLAEGINTRIFPGDQGMLSIVTLLHLLHYRTLAC